MTRLSADDRQKFGRRFADLLSQGVSVPEIASRFDISSRTVRRCLLAIDVPEAKVALDRADSLLDPETIAMLHRFRDEIRVADRIAIANERVSEKKTIRF